jgi:hypothetical protein
MATEISTRMQAMDEQGIDVEALSINPNRYKVEDRDLVPRDNHEALDFPTESLAPQPCKREWTTCVP